MNQPSDDRLDSTARWVCWLSVGFFCLSGSVVSFVGVKMLPSQFLPAGFGDVLAGWQRLLAVVLFCGAFWASVRTWGLANQPRKVLWKDWVSIGFIVVLWGWFFAGWFLATSIGSGRKNDCRPIGPSHRMIKNYSSALSLYMMDNGQFPTTAQGLQALIAVPTNGPIPKNWRGPYLVPGIIRLDPWGSAYVYRCPGIINPNSFDVVSPGPNKIVGDVDDITYIE